MDTEGSSDLHAQAAQGNAPQGGEYKLRGAQTTPLTCPEALLGSLWLCLHYPTALFPLLLYLQCFILTC